MLKSEFLRYAIGNDLCSIIRAAFGADFFTQFVGSVLYLIRQCRLNGICKILRTSQAVSYALAFFRLDGFAVPAPAQVTQTVSRLLVKQIFNHYVKISAYSICD